MEIKKTPHINNQSTERKKEERVPPRRSFLEVMAARKAPRQPEKRRSVFDMAGKKSESRKEKKEVDHHPQHGEGIQEGMAPLEGGESLSVGSVSRLSPEMAILMEKMANFILVEAQNGVSTTTVMVDMDGSALDGMEIVIDHYDTAPHSFNLQMAGSPEAQDLLAANLASLQTSLQTHQTLQGFQVHILPPILSEKSDLHLRGKGRIKRERIDSKKKISF